MEVDIRKIRCGGWDSSHINVKVNGRWRYLYKPNSLRPLNVREPIDFTGGYKPPPPPPSIAKFIQSQRLINSESLNKNNTIINIPIAGSTLRASKNDSFHPTRKRFLMTSAVNRPKAPYLFYQKDKKTKLSQSVEIPKSINQESFQDESNEYQDSYFNNLSQTYNPTFSSSLAPPFMSNENFQRFHERSQKKCRIRRKSFGSSLDQKINKDEDLDDNIYSDIPNLSMTQTSFSKESFQNPFSSTVPKPIVPNNDDLSIDEDSLYFLTATQPRKSFNPQTLINTEASLPVTKRPKEKRNPSINGHSKPLMKFKCMVRPQVDGSFRGDTSKLEGIFIRSDLSEDVKNYLKEAKERQKQLQKEYEEYNYYQEYQNYTY